MARGREAAHRALALASRLMRVFCSGIEALVFALRNAGHHVLLRCCVTAEVVGDQHMWHILAAVEQFAENFFAATLFRRLCTRMASTLPC
jgi:hypothetical protein